MAIRTILLLPFQHRPVALLILACATGVCSAQGKDSAEQNGSNPPQAEILIALILDDLGNQRLPGERAVKLDGPVACAIMPHTAHATYLANKAYAAGKEVILHLPMQPVEMQRIAGPGEISLDTSRTELSQILDQNLLSVPNASGISNHMGSLVTRHPGHMRWLMEELRQRDNLFFIDSFTTADSVAYAVALESGVPTARRHVFLDNEQTLEGIAREFAELKRLATRQGYAIGIGHPYSVTLDFLESSLGNLEKEGFRLVPVATIIQMLQTEQLERGLSQEPDPEESVIAELRSEGT